MRSSDNLHTGIQKDEAWKARWREKHWKSPASASFSGGERNHFFLSLGGKQFDDIAGLAGLDSPSDSRAWGAIDINHDGLTDIAMVNSNNPGFSIYRNEAAEVFNDGVVGNMIALDLRGGHQSAEPSTEWSNREGIGAKVIVQLPDGTRLLREKRRGEGFASQNSATLLVGVGKAEHVSHIEITWPSGKTSTVNSVGVGQRVEIFENPAHSEDGSGYAVRPYFDRRDPALAAGEPSPEADAGRTFTVAGADAPDTAKLRVYTTTATWCPSCKKHLPQFGVLKEAVGDAAVFFGLPMDAEDTSEMLESYVAEYKPGYELVIELADEDRVKTRTLLDETIRKDVLPSTIVTDADGRVLLTMAGIPSVSDLRALLMR